MWDDRYAEAGYAYGREPNEFLFSVADALPRGRALCQAAGEGRNAVFLAGLGFEVVAVDSSEVGLSKARRLASERGVIIETVCADLVDYVIQAKSWNVITSIFCHLPTDLRRQVHAATVRGLVPGGVFVLEGYSTKQLEYGTGGPPSVDRLYTLNDTRAELAGMDFEISHLIERSVIEGEFHTGLASVIQLFARKPVLQGTPDAPKVAD